MDTARNANEYFYVRTVHLAPLALLGSLYYVPQKLEMVDNYSTFKRTQVEIKSEADPNRGVGDMIIFSGSSSTL